ncbi:MAG: PAS domain S-box protein, partial [Planctomycetota bacterium]
MAVTTEKPLGERPVCRLIHLDDDADQRTRVAASLQRLLPFGQVDLRSADDANTFETLLGGEPVDCVITDTRLGWTDAGEVLRLVREHSPGTGVVLYSGDDNAETAARLIDSGADDFLLKSPDAADRLSKSVETVVKQHRATQREKQTPPMFAAVPIGLWRSDIDGNLLDANPALRNLLGTGDQPANLFNTLDNADDYARLLRRLRADGHVVGFDTQLTRPDGRRRRVRIDATLLDDGATPLIEGSLTDITERERTRRMTALRAQHLRSVFERSSVGMSVTELPGQRLTEVNGRLAAMFGYTPDELLDKPLSILWHPDERAAVMTRLNHV